MSRSLFSSSSSSAAASAPRREYCGLRRRRDRRNQRAALFSPIALASILCLVLFAFAAAPVALASEQVGDDAGGAPAATAVDVNATSSVAPLSSYYMTELVWLGSGPNTTMSFVTREVFPNTSSTSTAAARNSFFFKSTPTASRSVDLTEDTTLPMDASATTTASTRCVTDAACAIGKFSFDTSLSADPVSGQPTLANISASWPMQLDSSEKKHGRASAYLPRLGGFQNEQTWSVLSQPLFGDLASGDFTISFWYKMATPQSGVVLFAEYQQTAPGVFAPIFLVHVRDSSVAFIPLYGIQYSSGVGNLLYRRISDANVWTRVTLSWSAGQGTVTCSHLYAGTFYGDLLPSFLPLKGPSRFFINGLVDYSSYNNAQYTGWVDSFVMYRRQIGTPALDRLGASGSIDCPVGLVFADDDSCVPCAAPLLADPLSGRCVDPPALPSYAHFDMVTSAAAAPWSPRTSSFAVVQPTTPVSYFDVASNSVKIAPASTSFVMFGGGDANVWLSTDRAASWRLLAGPSATTAAGYPAGYSSTFGASAGQAHCYSRRTGRAFVLKDASVFTSTDFRTWTAITAIASSTSNTPYFYRSNGFCVVDSAGAVFHLSGGAADAWVSFDNGTSWSVRSVVPWVIRAGVFGTITLAPRLGPDLIYAMGGDNANDVFVSSDGAQSWLQLSRNAPWLPRSSAQLVSAASSVT